MLFLACFWGYFQIFFPIMKNAIFSLFFNNEFFLAFSTNQFRLVLGYFNRSGPEVAFL